MDGIPLGADFLGDVEVTRYSSKKKSEKIILSFKHETLELICKDVKSGKVDLNVSLFEIKEVRTGKGKGFEKWAGETKKIENSRSFVVLYGLEFRLETLSIAAPSKQEAESWVRGLEYLIDKRPSSYLAKLDVWFAKQYENMIAPYNQNCLTLKQMKDFTNTISFKISTGKLREKFELVQDENGTVSSLTFQQLVREFLHDQQIFTEVFGKYALKTDRINLNQFQEFLQKEQTQVKDTDYMPYFRQHLNSGSKELAYMTAHEAVDFLFSKQNQVWNSMFDKVHQDMTKPMSHFWIASSHKTYLMGDQLSSESSVEAYARCLRQGCRCVQLDCWDGPNGIPVIYHGHTLTTKVCFVDVLKTIRDHAFVTSEYPVILSIENHCSLKQQKVMAKKFKEIFGKILVTQPLFETETELPSPHQLRRRILLNCKKMPTDPKKRIEEPENETMGLSDMLKTGKMYIQEGTQWEPHFFALTYDKLIYTEIDDEHEKDFQHFNSNSVMPIEELHYSKKWFHGKIPGGVTAAEELVTKHGAEGGFLVTQSETNAGDYSLCFLSQNGAHHIQIKSNAEQTQCYLNPSKQFHSLYTLISHYRHNPLETQDFYIDQLTSPVPQPEILEQLFWFYPNSQYPDPMTQKKAEEILQAIPLNGAFLVRYSTGYLENGEEHRFVISFRNKKDIKHCHVKEDGRFFVVSNQRFESINKLVTHFSKHSFYKGVKLKHGVNEDLYKFAESVWVSKDDELYKEPDFWDANNLCYVRALYACQPNDPDLLRFERGDVISNVEKQNDIWWKGDLGDQVQKMFSVDFVEEIEPGDSPFGELQKGSVRCCLGKVDVEKTDDERYPFVLKITGLFPVPFKASVKTLKEAKDWKKMIKFANNQRIKRYQIQKKSKIAKEFSKLIVYCCTVPKRIPDDVKTRGRVFNEVTSYTEVAAGKEMSADPEFYVWLNEVQFSRIYPKGERVDSFNYNPIRHWNLGCQMVALNYQTPDRPMQLNHGKFRQNGGCGYVLRPEFMFNTNFDPGRDKDLAINDIQTLTFEITIIAARLLTRTDNKAISSSFVEAEIIGADIDCQKICATKYIADNGFNPFWNEKFTFKVRNPDLALVRFAVSDHDSFGDSYLLGQATYPVNCLREGFRSVPLENGYGEELMSSMLIHLQCNIDLDIK